MDTEAGTTSAGRRLPLGNVALLTACGMLQMILQFLLLTLVASWFGTSAEVDAFNAALIVPVSIASLLAAPLPLVLVPEMVRIFGAAKQATAWRLAGVVLAGFLGVGTLLAVLLIWQPSLAAGFFFGGFAAPVLAEASGYMQVLAWLIPLNGAITILQALHHARQHFRLAAFSGVLGVALPVVWVLFIAQPGLLDFARATVAGAGLAVALLLVPLLAPLLSCWQAAGGLSVGLRRFAILVSPLVFAGLYSRLDPLVDRMIASYLPAGSIAQLGYAQRLVTAMAMFVSSGLSITIFPRLAASASSAHHTHHADLLAGAWRFMIFLVVPLLGAVFVFGRQIVADLFQRGEFTAADTGQVAMVLNLLMGVLIAGAFGEIATKSLYARGATKLPALIAMVGFTIGIGLKLLLAKEFGVRGVAAATSSYYLVNLLAFLALIYYSFGKLAFVGSRRALGGSAVATAGAILVGAVPGVFLQQGAAILGGGLGFVTYVGLQSLLGNEFLPRRRRGVSGEQVVTAGQHDVD